MDSLRSFTLCMAGNWFCEPVEKIPIFLAPLRQLQRRWMLVLPNQPYYVEEAESIQRELRAWGLDCKVWFGSS